MAGPHTSGYRGTGSVVAVGHGNGMGLDTWPRSKKRRIVVGSVLLTLGVLTIVGGVTLPFPYAPFFVIGALLVITGLSELRKGKGF
jgi:hypothetical protein